MSDPNATPIQRVMSVSHSAGSRAVIIGPPSRHFVDTGGQARSSVLVLSTDWAQAVTRLQQLHNQGCTLVRLLEDDRGRVRIEPGG